MTVIALIAVGGLLILAGSTLRMWAAEAEAAAFNSHTDDALAISDADWWADVDQAAGADQ